MFFLLGNKKETCCGCWACINVCPYQAMTMKEDYEGFIYPLRDEDLCLGCGQCEKVCPVIHPVSGEKKLNPPIVLAAWHKNEQIRLRSSSGGVFTAMAESVLNQGGVVCGAAFKADLMIHHQFVENKEDLSLLRGSKYVQSQIGDVYQKINKFLMQGRKVLFSGTPCQVSGLYSFLRKDDLNLLTCDLVCHGVPSTMIFRRYLQYIEKRFNSKPISLSFRDKSQGWENYRFLVDFDNGSQFSESGSQNYYMNGFLKNIFLRPSCYRCQFTGIPRKGDITLGDFWGIGSQHPELDDGHGTSLVLLNTDKAKKTFDDVMSNLFFSECQIELAIGGNPCLIGPVAASQKREQFFIDFYQLQFERLLKKYMKPSSKLRSMFKKLVWLLSKFRKYN